jgi:hypothetical protein
MGWLSGRLQLHFALFHKAVRGKRSGCKPILPKVELVRRTGLGDLYTRPMEPRSSAIHFEEGIVTTGSIYG